MIFICVSLNVLLECFNLSLKTYAILAKNRPPNSGAFS